MTTTNALRATAHPLRLQILSLLTGAELSAAEVARELDTTQANASYHLRVLARVGLLEPAGEERIRGGVAKRYRHPWQVGRPDAGSPSETELLDRQAHLQAMAHEVVRRSTELSLGRTNFTDAELWVAPQTWQDCAELIDQAATLLHRAAPPATDSRDDQGRDERSAVPHDGVLRTVANSGLTAGPTIGPAGAPMRLPDSLSPLRDRRFAWFFGGRFISMMGSVMAPVALTFAVLDLTDSPSALGAVLAAHSIPLVLFLLIGGVVADRFSRSMVMQVSHLSSAATQGLVAVLLLTGTAELWMVIVLEALNGIVSAFTFPAMQGVVPLVVQRTYIQQANALLGFTRNGLAILGPTVAALLVVTVGSGWAIAVDAATWAVAAFCMSRLKLEGAMKMAGPKSSMVRDLKQGWTAFTTHTWVWVVVVSFGVLNAIHAGALFTLGPVIAKQTIGVTGWGYVLSAEAAGMLVMTLVMLSLRLHRPLRAGMLGVCLLGGPMIVLGVDPTLLALVPLAFLGGCGVEVFGVGWQTAMHEHIPNEVMSRVASYDALGSFVAIPIGQLVYGPLAQVFDASDIMLVSGLLYVAISLATLASSSVRNLERAPVSSAETPSTEGAAHG